MSAYSDLKEVGKDAWDFGSGLAPYVFGEKNIDGSSTEVENKTIPAYIPEDGEYFDEPYKPTSGNETFDTVLEWFL